MTGGGTMSEAERRRMCAEICATAAQAADLRAAGRTLEADRLSIRVVELIEHLRTDHH